MVLAGGIVPPLNILSTSRAKAAIPIGGIYRIIDFALSNLMNSRINIVGILTQYRPGSLIDHVGIGASWDFVGRTRYAKILPPYKGVEDSDWYRGTADAIYQNINFIQDHNPDYVLVLSAEHVYTMNYTPLMEFHIDKKADCTLVCKKLPVSDPSRFGILKTDEEGRVLLFEEKPQIPEGDSYFLGVYVFTTNFLLEKLQEDAERSNSSHSLVYDIVPNLVQKNQLYAYKFTGTWEYCASIVEYWKVNMGFLDEKPAIDLWECPVRTNLEDRNVGDRSPARFDSSAEVINSLISPGCVIKGLVERSVLSPGVIIEKSAIVRDSVIMHDTQIGSHALVENIVCDKDVQIGTHAIVGTGNSKIANTTHPAYFNTGITVLGKGAKVIGDVQIGRNCLVYPGVVISRSEYAKIPSGSSIK
jgi:glucose-1-phosphate adenylyltransferase